MTTGPRLVFDLETVEIIKSTGPGIPDTLPDKIHCCCVMDVDSCQTWTFVDREQWQWGAAQVGHCVLDGWLDGPWSLVWMGV